MIDHDPEPPPGPSPFSLGDARPRDVMAAHRTRDGVWCEPRVWIVTARCG
jgi:hypothetical protein